MSLDARLAKLERIEQARREAWEREERERLIAALAQMGELGLPGLTEEEEDLYDRITERPDSATYPITDEEFALLCRVREQACAMWTAAGYWCAHDGQALFAVSCLPPGDDGLPTGPYRFYGRLRSGRMDEPFTLDWFGPDDADDPAAAEP